MAERLAIRLPTSLIAEREGAVAILRLNRPQKRNALDDETILGIEQFFTSIPDGVGAVVLTGEEVVALERAIQAYTSNTGSSDVAPLKSVQQKLNEAKDKMLPGKPAQRSIYCTFHRSCNRGVSRPPSCPGQDVGRRLQPGGRLRSSLPYPELPCIS